MNGMQNDLPMATRDAIDTTETALPETPKGGSGKRISPEEFKDPEARYIAQIANCVDDLYEKFRTLQTRCNSVLAMQAQIEALLNELKIRMRGKKSEPKKARAKK
jgi:hypothetical protein